MTDRTIDWVFRATDRTTAAFRSVDSRIAGLTRSFKTFAGFAGFAALSTGIASVTGKLLELGGELSDASQKFGISAESLQALKFAAEQTGASFDSLQTAMAFNAKLTQQAIDGNKGAAEAFRQLGLDAKRFADLPFEQRLSVIAEQLSKSDNAAQKLAAAQRILGRSAADLMPLLAEGAAGLKQYETELRDSGALIEDQYVKSLGRAGDAWDKLKTRALAAAAEIVAVPLTGILNELDAKDLYGASRGPSTRRRGGSALSAAQSSAIVGGIGDFQSDAQIAAFEKASSSALKAQRLMAAGWEGVAADVLSVTEGIAKLGAEANRTFTDRAAQIKEQFADPLDVLQAKVLEVNQLFAGGLLGPEGSAVADRAVKAYADDYIRSLDVMQDKNLEVKTSTEEMFESLKLSADGFAADLTDAFFDSTQSIGEYFEKLATTIAKALFTQEVSEPLIKSILGSFGGARAMGGPVTGGTSYLVGERGPELFVPGASGTIIPNGAGGGVSIVNNFSVNSLDPQTAAQVLVANERLLTGMTRRAMQRAGVRPRLA